MALRYNHLERRKHTFYFRYWIPLWVRQFFEKEYIRYSLNTNDYNIAVHLVKRESFKYDTLLNDIRWLVMEIRNGKLHLSQDDIENIISNLADDYFEQAGSILLSAFLLILWLILLLSLFISPLKVGQVGL